MTSESYHEILASEKGVKPIKTKKDKLKILKGALTLLGKNGENWTKHKYFGNRVRTATSKGGAVASHGVFELRDANAFCLVGALKASAFDAGYEDWNVARIVSIFDLVTSETNFQEVESWNDHTSRKFPEVKDVLERRIAQLEGKENTA